MRLAFTKMHGLGNDFVVIDAIAQDADLAPAVVRFLADRRRGVGCDQVLVVASPVSPEADFRYRIFNADGTEVEQCGNGARCFARFVREKGLSDKDEIVVETAAGIIRPRLLPDGRVTVDMGSPRFEPGEIPLVAQTRALNYSLHVDGQVVTIGAVSMGNPHAVLLVDDVSTAPVTVLAPSIQAHDRFPRSANVGFMQVISTRHIRLRVYERGVGETLACGTGACAAVCVGRIWGLLEDRVEVDLPGGRLSVEWDGGIGRVRMTGPAVTVFDGAIDL